MNQFSIIITVVCLALGACGSDADPCTTVDNGDGTYTLNCPDSSPITIRNGMDGMDGMDGMEGTSGMDGTDGTSYLVDTADEPAGANCADGGVAITVGPDTNGNGTLDSDEVTATTYACNGANGAEGAAGVQTLVTTTDEPAGANCTSGGLRVDSGPDTDGSGSLDAGEVTATEYVCDGIGPDGLSMAREFPSPTSTLDSTFSMGPLGAGGGSATFQAGGNVEETITFDGVTSLDSLTIQFDMNDRTNSFCVVGTLTFDITVNGTTIGTYSYPGGNRFERIQFRESFEFASIAGTGAGTDEYTIRYEANETVCSGGGAYNWFAGGIVQTGL